MRRASSSIPLAWRDSDGPLPASFCNLLTNLDDERFGQRAVHHALEGLDARGIVPRSFTQTPEPMASWIDLEFGGVWSSEAASGASWILEDARGRLGFAAFDARGLDFHWLRRWKLEAGVGIFGPLGVVSRARGDGLGATLLHAALCGLRERGYRQALIPAVGGAHTRAFYERRAGARIVESFELERPGARYRATVLASGNGSNFAFVLDAARRGTLPLEISALVTNRSEAFARERARAAQLPEFAIVWDRTTESRENYDARVIEAVAATEPDIVLLLGWMHVLPEAFIARFPQILNLHPAFLPLDPSAETVTMPDGSVLRAFRGARAVDDALGAGASWIGATVHEVGVSVDRGRIMARLPLAIAPGEPRTELDARLHSAERTVLRSAIRRWGWER